MGRRSIDQIPQLQAIDAEQRLAIRALSYVLPFRTNNYVLDHLIDWDDIPNDPMFQLTFPQPEMLERGDLERLMSKVERGEPDRDITAEARRIQLGLNPHPAGQMSLNVPRLDGKRLDGVQHKYRETVLFFPKQGQTCHAYCTYCFRWAQFVGIDELKFAADETDTLVRYLQAHPEVTDVLITGGDPLIMKTKLLRRYIEPLLAADLPNLTSIRLGTKAPAYWPYRFTHDRDSDDLMRLFEEVAERGLHLAVMAHFTHHRELETAAAEAALRRIRQTGASIRCQAPLIRHVNDKTEIWSRMWRKQVSLGAVPYYMFIERDTGANHYFEVPLHHALRIFQGAYRDCSGLARTVRGPSMSATPGKVLIDGVQQIDGRPVFVLKFLQARNPEWVNRIFFAEYDERATWLDGLEPVRKPAGAEHGREAAGDRRFFWERDTKTSAGLAGSRGGGHPEAPGESKSLLWSAADETRRRRDNRLTGRSRQVDRGQETSPGAGA